ncbi:Programmed cell death 1 ligand 1 [Channa argus]|uniref:Programmed cell death 1 ligand 1 n=1 Tax=Channa argus TaxID=215402 RepID=A0A6G1Q7S8_CHAAH|nr:Programmed cell death 1 ligand 1 [Channa argus]
MEKLLIVFMLLAQAASDALLVQRGKDAILSSLTDQLPIIAVEWTTTNLTYPQYVLFFSDGHSDKTHQYPSFEGRVDLMDKKMKNGNLSIIIKNVSSSDSGIYECRVSSGGSRRKRANINSEPIATITLQVTDSIIGNPTDEGKKHQDLNHEMNTYSTHTHFGLVAILIVFFGVLVITVKRKTNQNSKLSTGENAVDRQLV